MQRALVFCVLVVLVGFDHEKHATQTNQALTCVNCHAVTKTAQLAKPSHATCFGKCHGAVPALPPKGKKLTVEPERIAVCRTCHTQTALDNGEKKSLAIRAPASENDFTLAVGHKRHAAVACAQCHQQTKPAPHARCANCHVGTQGKGPTMTLCTSCHLVADKTPGLPDARVLVRSTFSHAKHATRGTAAKCATCHRTDSDARELPHATAQTCAIAACHDGKAAFSTMAQCTKCHQDVPRGKFEISREQNLFSHEFHLPYVAFVACTTCHAVAKSGEVGLADHDQCAGCHEDQFGARKPTICSACHDAIEPWRKLLPDRPSLATSEFGASLDHGKHRGTCESCHNLTTASIQLRPPRGHAACSAKGCHATTGGVAPSFTNCDGCHELGIADRREAQRDSAPWSVRELFVHATHEKGPDKKPLACATCHIDMSGTNLMSIATPPKATCAPQNACHFDNTTTFKITGTACARCHVEKKKK